VLGLRFWLWQVFLEKGVEKCNVHCWAWLIESTEVNKVIAYGCLGL